MTILDGPLLARSGRSPDRECRWRSDMTGSRPLSD
jgi:hypothetical protein